MCRNETLAIAVSSTSMNAEIDMTLAMSHGLRSPAAERSGVQPPPPAPADAEDAPRPDRPSCAATSAHSDFWLDRHSRPQRTIPRKILEEDLHGYALHHLHIVARRVFGRQQCERLSRA